MRSKADNRIVFMAVIRPGNAGITIGDDGATIHLDVPETELAKALQAVKYRGQNIEVEFREA